MTDDTQPHVLTNRSGRSGQPHDRRLWVGYLVVVVGTLVAALLRWLLGRFFGEFPLFATFFPMVALVAMTRGGRAGALATVLSLVVADVFFRPPSYALVTSRTTVLLSSGLFVFVGLLVSGMAEVLDRARQRNASSRREILLQTLAEGVPDPLFIKDVDSRIVIANTATIQAIGKPSECIIGHTDAEFYDDPVVANAMMSNDRRVIDVGQPLAMEEVLPAPDGHRVFQTIKAPWRDEQGRIIGIIGCARDITERKHVEQTQAESEARLRAFFEQAAVGTAVADPTTYRFTKVNARYCEITGYSEAELLGLTIWDVTHSVDRDEDRKRYDAMVTGTTSEYLAEKRYLRKDRQVIWVQVAIGLVRDEQGRATQSIGVIQDITQRRRTEEALRESEAGLAAAQQLAHIGSWQWDVQTDTGHWSDETFRIFGLTPIGLNQHRRNFLGRVHPDDRQRVNQAMTDALRTGNYDLEYRILRPDGSERVVHARAEVLRNGDGTSTRLRGTVHDITDRKHWENRLQQLNATLEQRVTERTAEAENRAVQLRNLAAQLIRIEQKERQRLATILHDHLQQILASTKFHVGSISRKPQASPVRDSLQQVDDLLNEAISTSRNLTAELSPPVLRQGNMKQVLEWLAQWFSSKHGLTVEVHADEHVSPASHEVRALLFEAVKELLFNIVKYAKVDRAFVDLTLAGDKQIEVVVADRGVGLAATQIRQQDSSGGFGLLSIRERLDWLGGQMEVHSAAGEGTRVTLLVPIRLEGQEAPPTPMQIEELAGTRPDPTIQRPVGQKARILLADDHEVVRNGLAQLLNAESWIEVVGQASTGRQVVDMAIQHRPHVIIMDVSLPQLDGIQATREIVAKAPGIKVIGLSMFDEQSVADAMKDAGATTYLAKTCGPETLISAIRQCVTERTPPDHPD